MYLLQEGAPAEKLVLGLAMYGRTFVLTSVPETPKINPIGLPSLHTGFKGPYTSEDGFMGFNEVFPTISYLYHIHSTILYNFYIFDNYYKNYFCVTFPCNYGTKIYGRNIFHMYM